MDRIFVRDLLVRCIIGLTESERRERQDVRIGLILLTDLAAAGKSDRVEDSVNYRDLKKRILADAERSSFHLMEALAEQVAATCLSYDRVQRATVTIEKPAALRFARTVGVRITRARAG